MFQKGNKLWNSSIHLYNEKTRFKKGHIGYGKGKHLSEEHKRKISEAKKGKPHYNQREERAYNWKGDKAGKDAMHHWVEKWRGKPNYCEICGTTEKRIYDWANIDHKYRRVLDDYIRVCRSCHRKYDLKYKKGDYHLSLNSFSS